MFCSYIFPEMVIFILLGDLPLHLTHASLHTFIHTDSHTYVHTYMLHAYINTSRHTDRHTHIHSYLPTCVRTYAYTLIFTFTLLKNHITHHHTYHILYILHLELNLAHFTIVASSSSCKWCFPFFLGGPHGGSKKVKTEKLQKRIKEQQKYLGKTMGVEPNIGVGNPPEIIPFVHRIFHYKPSILEVFPYFWVDTHM